MTLRLAIVGCVVCCASARAEQFPYTAYVNARHTYLRSGPGENYYAVAELARGQQVEIYRHDPGGWYAVKPPPECFSWVSADFIEPRGKIGVVTGDRVVARVGSTFSDTRDVIQVRLDRGEEVEIIEAQELNSGPAAQTWYKILPPAGEFRWVSGRDVDREIAQPKGRGPVPEKNLLNAPPKRRSSEQDPDGEPADEVQSDVPGDEDEYDGAQVRRATHEEPAPRGSKRSRSPRPLSRDDADEDESPADEDAPPSRIRLESRQPKANLKEEAEDLDLALSAMVVEEPARWDFTLLRRQAEAALNRAQTALDRGRIRRVVRKIDNFADIRRRHLAVMNSTDRADRTHQGLAVADRPSGGRASGLSSPRYDGVGRLTQISSVDPRLPQFALVDSAGRVAAYVSPAPGVNLRRYLNQEVGINGTLGYLPERQATHLTAKRIVPAQEGPIR